MSRNIDLTTTHLCPHRHLDCGTNGRLCGNCGDDYMKQLLNESSNSSRIAFASGGRVSTEKVCECGKRQGSNRTNCGICASIWDSPSNTNQPEIPFDREIGPMKGSFGATSHEITRMVLEQLKIEYERIRQGLSSLPDMNSRLPRFTTNAIRNFLMEGYVFGIEGWNNSCFLVCVIWVLSQGDMWRRINTNTLSGYILYKIVFELRSRGFVGRDIIEAFRFSLREYSITRGGNDLERGLNDPNEVLGLLEECTILLRGPMFSDIGGCSFVVNETRVNENHFNNVQDAVCASISDSGVPIEGSILSFQLCLQKLGTQMPFPFDGIVVRGKLLRVKMFYIFRAQHYEVVFCVGDTFIRANSLSASINGHFLPVMTEISENEAMRLFRECAHTIVFSCDGDAFRKEGDTPVLMCDAPAFRKDEPPPPNIVIYGGEKYYYNHADRTMILLGTRHVFSVEEEIVVFSCALSHEISICPKQPDVFPTQSFCIDRPEPIQVLYDGRKCWYYPSMNELRSNGPVGGLIDEVSGYIDVMVFETRERITIFLKKIPSQVSQQRPTQQRPFEEIYQANIVRGNGCWSLSHNGFNIRGGCFVNAYHIGNQTFDMSGFLAELNRLYREFCSKK